MLGYGGRFHFLERWRMRVAVGTLARYGGGSLVVSGHGGEAERLAALAPPDVTVALETTNVRRGRTSNVRCRCSRMPNESPSRLTTSMSVAPPATSKSSVRTSPTDSSHRSGDGGMAGGSTRSVPCTRRSSGCASEPGGEGGEPRTDEAFVDLDERDPEEDRGLLLPIPILDGRIRRRVRPMPPPPHGALPGPIVI